jgi:hypothetical protein
MSVFTPDVTFDPIPLPIDGGNPNAVLVTGTVTANLGTVDGLALDATLTNGTQHTLVDNFPATQPISGSVTVLNASIPVTGTFWQAVQPVSGTVTLSNPGLTDAQLRASPVPVSGTVAVSNFPATVAVTQSTSPWVVSGTVTANLGTVDGLALDATLTNGTQVTSVSNFPAIQPVSGTVAVSNFPASVEVSNDVGNPLPVSGTVAVSNFPADADALAQGSTTAGQLGALEMGAVTTGAPVYVTATTRPLSLDTAGNLRVATVSAASLSDTVVQITSTGANQVLLAANAARKKAILYFESGIWHVKFGATASASSKTYMVTSSNTTIEVPVWAGEIDALCTTSGKLVDVTEMI